MPCSLPRQPHWSALLAARELLAQGTRSLAFVQRAGAWSCCASRDLDFANVDAVLLADATPDERERAARAELPSTCFDLVAGGGTAMQHLGAGGIDDAFATTARVYLPVLLGAAAARRAGRSFVAGHVTQTIDGRIACENGQSQWIGNEADLHHAHRMRALLDGVMVGATTVLRDDPQLNVRHVPGRDPRRIVVSGRGNALTTTAEHKVLQPPGCELFVDAALAVATPHASVHVHHLAAEDGRLDPRAVLDALQQRGIHSVYLEGGSGTLSSFLLAGCIDLLQVHISAMVLGSGVPSLSLPPVQHVDQAMRLQLDHALLDGHVLLTCWPCTTTAR